jgi:16S rRNA (guanine966-N2)-methyltransferase
MRIIAGEFRGRKFLPPEGDVTRPITDRVKQSLFDILTPVIDGARVYDCFAGTGSMGLECLSRGAAHVTFFEADRSAIERLKKNIAALGVAGKSQVVPGDLHRWFASIANSHSRAGAVDIVFLDPPYRHLKEQPNALQRLAKLIVLHHLRPSGTLVFRHGAADALELPALRSYDSRTYGGMMVEFLRPAEAKGDALALPDDQP